MYMVKRRGPSTEPWEKPWLTRAGVEQKSPMVINCFRLVRYCKDLGGHCPFQGLAQERKVGDWPVVIGVVGVETEFLEGGSDGSRFESGRNNTRLKREVNDGDRTGAEDGEARLDDALTG